GSSAATACSPSRCADTAANWAATWPTERVRTSTRRPRANRTVGMVGVAASPGSTTRKSTSDRALPKPSASDPSWRTAAPAGTATSSRTASNTRWTSGSAGRWPARATRPVVGPEGEPGEVALAPPGGAPASCQAQPGGSAPRRCAASARRPGFPLEVAAAGLPTGGAGERGARRGDHGHAGGVADHGPHDAARGGDHRLRLVVGIGDLEHQGDDRGIGPGEGDRRKPSAGHPEARGDGRVDVLHEHRPPRDRDGGAEASQDVEAARQEHAAVAGDQPAPREPGASLLRVLACVPRRGAAPAVPGRDRGSTDRDLPEPAVVERGAVRAEDLD